jgi:hypothetical protein
MALKNPSITQLRNRVSQEKELGTDERMARVADAIAVSDNPADIVSQISTLWHDVQKRFVSIGRHLNRAQDLIERQTRTMVEAKGLPEVEARKMARAAYEEQVIRRLPFSDKVASQLSCVARAIDGKRLLESEVPSSYSIVYQLTTLTDDELAKARDENIVRPDVSRDEVIAFKKKVRKRVNLDVSREVQLRARRRRVLEEMERLRRELEDIDGELGTGETIDVTAERFDGAEDA